MANVLTVKHDKCTSCRLCELACSEKHYGAYQPSRSCIQVAIHQEKALYLPKVCLQCDDSPCVLACPNDAIARNNKTNALQIDGDKCDQCGICQAACPHEAIHSWDDQVHICDLCNGDPQCVRSCTEGALQFVPESDETQALLEVAEDCLIQMKKEVGK